MERIELKTPAGVIKAYRYDELHESLEVEFQDGRRAVHSGVALTTYEAFTRSEQPGKFWAVAIMRRGHKSGKPGHATRWIGA